MDIDKVLIAALVERAKDGDQKALREIFAHYSGPMFNICIRMTANRQDAEDILQDSFISAFNNLHKIRDPLTFGGWFRQIVVNNCLASAKKRKVFEALPESYDEAGDSDIFWLEEHSFQKIHEAIKRLPEGCRQIFLLYTMEDLKHKEIGAKLNITESTSKSQYLRAKKLLLNHLKKDQWIK